MRPPPLLAQGELRLNPVASRPRLAARRGSDPRIEQQLAPGEPRRSERPETLPLDLGVAAELTLAMRQAVSEHAAMVRLSKTLQRRAAQTTRGIHSRRVLTP